MEREATKKYIKKMDATARQDAEFVACIYLSDRARNETGFSRSSSPLF